MRSPLRNYKKDTRKPDTVIRENRHIEKIGGT